MNDLPVDDHAAVSNEQATVSNEQAAESLPPAEYFQGKILIIFIIILFHPHLSTSNTSNHC